jgi:hypothetical protein
MLLRSRFLLAGLALAVLTTGAFAAKGDPLASLEKGTPKLSSAGPLAFGPSGILFIGDPKAATIYAIDTGDRTASDEAGRPMVKNLNEKIAGLLGTEVRGVRINDLAVNPISGNTYLSITRGSGPGAMPVILEVARSGKISEFSTKNVAYAKAELPNAPSAKARGRRGSPRMMSITDMAYVDGQLIVAGLSNEEWASTLRSIPFPFKTTDKGTSVGIFHGSHGRFETAAPVRTFVPYEVGGKPQLLAAYTCTPLVRFPVSDLKPGAQVKGTTVAELGNRNNPLDMIVYKKGGKDYLLIANSSRGVMKLPTEGIGAAGGITAKVAGATAGMKYEKVTELKGVIQMDAFDKDHALVLLQEKGGALTLKTIELP